MSSQVENQSRLARPEAGSLNMPRAQRFLAAGGVIGELAASSCCIVPLVLFGLGVSGAWIANLTQLAPYQPYFIAATVACLAGGYGLMYRSRRRVCTDGQVCARPLSNRIVTSGLILATILVIGALGSDSVWRSCLSGFAKLSRLCHIQRHG
jgi:mercuric ion transport protein